MMRYQRRSNRWVVFAIIVGLGGVAHWPARAGDVGFAELSTKAEHSIDRALSSLAKKQKENGSFDSRNQTASAALGLMAFMLQGHFPGRGEYGARLDLAIQFLLSESKRGSGYMGKSMYEHGLATLALSEAWGMSYREELRDSLRKGVDVIIRSQNRQGGWRYKPVPKDADVSVTVMQLVALISAHESGIYVPDKVIAKGVSYVVSCQVPGEWGFGYTNAQNPAFPRSAAGTLAFFLTGHRGKAVQRALLYLKRSPDSKFDRMGQYFYGHYYAIQAMYQAGDREYHAWYPRIREALLRKQRRDGGWGSAVDTSFAVLILGVPYRFLPIYQR